MWLCAREANDCMRLVTKIYETQSNQITIMFAVQSINDFFLRRVLCLWTRLYVFRCVQRSAFSVTCETYEFFTNDEHRVHAAGCRLRPPMQSRKFNLILAKRNDKHGQRVFAFTRSPCLSVSVPLIATYKYLLNTLFSFSTMRQKVYGQIYGRRNKLNLLPINNERTHEE